MITTAQLAAVMAAFPSANPALPTPEEGTMSTTTTRRPHLAAPTNAIIEALAGNVVAYPGRGEYDPRVMTPDEARIEAYARLGNPKLRVTTRRKLEAAIMPTAVGTIVPVSPEPKAKKPGRKADPAKAAANLAFRRVASMAEKGNIQRAGRLGTKFAYEFELSVEQVERLSDEALIAIGEGNPEVAFAEIA